MKKISFILVMFLFLTCSIFADTYPFIGHLYLTGPEAYYYFGEDKFEITKYSYSGDCTVYTYDCNYVEKDAYLVAEISNDHEQNELYIFCADKEHVLFYDKKNKESIVTSRAVGHRDEPWIWSVFNLSATSELTEILNGESVTYSCENMTIYLLNKSWVEGVDGPGIGESVSFLNVGEGSRRIYFINGFFSPDKTSLYYDNNRVKKLKVNCYDRNGNLVDILEKEIADTGHMQVIEFDKRYDRFDFIIEEVYPGNKYDDTAITGIFADALDLYRN